MGRVVTTRIRVSLTAAALLAVALVSTPALAGVPAFAQSPAKASVETSVEVKTAAIDRILADYQDEQAKRDPERVSLSGDKRYNDQLSDLSASAANTRLERGQTYIQRLSQIDLAGLPQKTRTAAEGLLNKLIDEQSADRPKTWQMPLDQFSNMHTQLLALTEKLSFDSIKDYDDYLSRLHKIPKAFSQIMTNIQLGADAGRILPRAGVEKALAQIKTIAEHPPEASPFAAPLNRLPPSIPAADRQRISTDLLDAIATDVIPSYRRVGRFVAARASSASSPGLASTR